MCDVDAKLAAWLDRELPEEEAAKVEQHVKSCAECRQRSEAYGRASTAFGAYCDALTATEMRRPASILKTPAVVVGAVAAGIALALLTHFSGPIRQPQLQPHVSAPVAAAPRTAVAETGVQPKKSVSAGANGVKRLAVIAANPVKKTLRAHVSALVPRPEPDLSMAGPAVQITIPADSVLPPGAVPLGADFVVDLRIAPDGSAQAVRLSPQLAGFQRSESENGGIQKASFERRANQP